MRRGRPVEGPRLVEKLVGSEDAKRKLRLVLEVVAGEKTIEEACSELGIGRTAFYELRDRLLLAALSEGEPKPVGRPRNLEPEPLAEAARLKAENKRLRVELEVAYVREELRLGMPQLFADQKKRRSKRKRKRRERRKPAAGGEPGGEAPGGDGDGVAGGGCADPSG